MGYNKKEEREHFFMSCAMMRRCAMMPDDVPMCHVPFMTCIYIMYNVQQDNTCTMYIMHIVHVKRAESKYMYYLCTNGSVIVIVVHHWCLKSFCA